VTFVTFDRVPELPAKSAPWGALASVLVHATILAVVLVLPATKPFTVPPTRSIAVDILSAAQFAQLLGTAKAPVVVSTARPQVTQQEREPTMPTLGADGMLHAHTLHAGAVLDDPTNKRLVAQLGNVADSERLVQLCDIEGIEQLRDWNAKLDPDVIVPYAMADMTTHGRTLVADGAAFRNNREWFALRFTCTVAADLKSVIDFAFIVGDAIPREQWEEHYLTEEEADDDDD
jgi:hypothetical protein